MDKFYFTFGTDERFPYQRGQYVMVEADSEYAARELFKAVHPNREHRCLNCADVYTQSEWDTVPMSETGVLAETISIAIDKGQGVSRDRMSEIIYDLLNGMLQDGDGKVNTVKYARNVVGFNDTEMARWGLDAIEDELLSQGVEI